MSVHHLYFLKRAPFFKILCGLMVGIVTQWHLQLNVSVWLFSILGSLLFLSAYSFLSVLKRYKARTISGLLSFVFVMSFGAIITWYKDVRNDEKWMGKAGIPRCVIAIIQEPLVEKQNSFKALAKVSLFDSSSSLISQGTVILYFEKDSIGYTLDYGSRIIFKNNLQTIKSSGNPGAFDYQRYCIFQGITHQVYLRKGDFQQMDGRKTGFTRQNLFRVQAKVLRILRNYISGEKEIGLAEALLIGYKNDLDKSLVQSYSNTGVIHVIAISGLHIGLIYWLLELMFKPFARNKVMRWLKPILIIVGLWGFSLLAGAQPSVLRSAVMFTCIVVANAVSKKSSIYNTLAFSAFMLLCYNPYWLWDAGFQLSYSAVLSILIFMKPIYNLIYCRRKFPDMIWKLIAVTVAAQILTLPVSIFHFHQFPNYFILTNIVAVPLSSLIVLGEIFLCAVSFVPLIAQFVGQIVTWLIILMNEYVQLIELLPYSKLEDMQISVVQTLLLYCFIGAMAFWLLERNRAAVWIAGVAILFFSVIRAISFNVANEQKKLIVYNMPKRLAMDVFIGRHYSFVGDPTAQTDEFLSSFHLKPARVLHRTPVPYLGTKFDGAFTIGGKSILILQDSTTLERELRDVQIDILIISGKPKLYLSKLPGKVKILMVVFSGSASSLRKIWKRDCDSLKIPYHDVNEKGAFVVNLN